MGTGPPAEFSDTVDVAGRGDARVGGVRIEDTVLVTADGCEILTGSPKDLVL